MKLHTHTHAHTDSTYLYGSCKLSLYLDENFSSSPSATTVRMLLIDSKAI